MSCEWVGKNKWNNIFDKIKKWFTIDILKKIPSIYAYNVQYVTKVDKIDTQSLQITIDHEIPFFEYNLIFPIMNKNYYEGQDFSTTEKNNAPIGTGKYKIVQNDTNQIVLEKNENYSRSELTLEKIVIGKYGTLSELYNAFKLGKVDLITTNNINIEDANKELKDRFIEDKMILSIVNPK